MGERERKRECRRKGERKWDSVTLGERGERNRVGHRESETGTEGERDSAISRRRERGHVSASSSDFLSERQRR